MELSVTPAAGWKGRFPPPEKPRHFALSRTTDRVLDILLTGDLARLRADNVAEKLGMPKELVMRHRTPQFGHVFSGDGYSAGYYSYLWADALTSDAAEAFTEGEGFYDRDVANQYMEHILSAGNRQDAADAWMSFRGREVDTAALMRARGFPVTQ